MAGRVVERKVDLGTAVGRDNLETELFVIVDLDRVWVELAVSPADLPVVKEGQSVSITIRGIPEKADGKKRKPKFSKCKSPKSYASLAAGKYTFEVRGTSMPGRAPPQRRSSRSRPSPVMTAARTPHFDRSDITRQPRQDGRPCRYFRERKARPPSDRGTPK